MGHGVMDIPGQAFALFQAPGLVLAGSQLGLGFVQLLGDVPVVHRLRLQPALDIEHARGKGRADKRPDGRGDGPAIRMQPRRNERGRRPQHCDGDKAWPLGQGAQEDEDERELEPHEVLRVDHQPQPEQAQPGEPEPGGKPARGRVHRG